MWYALNESDIDAAECRREVPRGRQVTGAIRSSINDRRLRLERAWLRQLDNFRGLLGIRIDRMPNTQVEELCGMKKGVVRPF